MKTPGGIGGTYGLLLLFKALLRLIQKYFESHLEVGPTPSAPIGLYVMDPEPAGDFHLLDTYYYIGS